MKHIQGANGKYNCHCCGCFTLDQEDDGSFEICAVCYWEDDGLQSDLPDYTGGANDFSLIESKANYRKFGATEERFIKHVRPPRPDELPS